MKKVYSQVFKIIISVALVMVLICVSFGIYKANLILTEAWTKDPLQVLDWNDYSKDFQIVATSELNFQNVKIDFTRLTLQRHLNGERIGQLKWHVLGFITYHYIKLSVSEEKALGKYLKHAYLGANTTGFAQASKYYLDKPIYELDLPDSALLFAISIAPDRNNPFKNIERAKEGRAIVLKRLERRGVSVQEIKKALEKPITLSKHKI